LIDGPKVEDEQRPTSLAGGCLGGLVYVGLFLFGMVLAAVTAHFVGFKLP
jgi:hypothetical protein